MATAIQRRRGNTAQHANFVGLAGEITIDTDLNTIIVHDGETAGGERLARFSELEQFSGDAITSVITTSESGLLGGSTSGAANISINYESLTGNLVPAANNTYSLGSPTNVWKDLYVGAETIFIDGIALSVVEGSLTFGNNAVAVADDPSVTTDGITEGNVNLYFTQARARGSVSASGDLGYNQSTGVFSVTTYKSSDFDDDFAGKSTTDLTEGTNLYFTPERVRGNVSASGDLDYNQSTGVFSVTTYKSADFDDDFAGKSTSDLSEGTNLYFTTARVRGNVSASGDLDYNQSTGVFSVTTYKSADFDDDFAGKSTTDLSEGTNLYFTTARARDSISATGNITYNVNTGVIDQNLTTADVAEGSNLYFTQARARNSFSGGTGVSITEGSIAIGQDVAVNANVSFNRVSNLLAPSDILDAANKQYVDQTAQGLKARTAARVLVDSNLAATYDNGADGVGATLTASANGAFPTTDGVDSEDLNEVGQRILVTGQSNAAHNGLYVVQVAGNGSTPWQLRRCVECDEDSEIPGSFVFVKEGTVYGATGWVAVTDLPFTVGTTAINWTQFSGAGTFLAGDGLELDGNTFKVLASGGLTTASGNVEIASSAAGNGLSFANGVLTVGAGAGITVNATNVALTSGIATAGTYGGLANSVPAVTIDTFGRTTGISNVAISITSGQVSDFTTAVRDNVSAGGDIDYNASTGVFSVTTYKSSDFDDDFAGKSTTDLSEGTNLYFTQARARGSVSASGDLDYNQSTGVFSVTTYKSSDFDTDFAGKSTTDLSEGTNLYFTTTRARNSFSNGTGVTITNGSIAIGQAVATTSDVTFASITGNGEGLTNLNASNVSSGTLGSAFLPELVVGDFADSAIQTSAESFADSDTVLMTAGAVEARILSKGYSTTTGTVTSVGSGNGLTGGPITGSGSLAVGAGAFIIVNASNVAVDATSANTANKVVARDGNGNFAANVITATCTQARYADLAERYEADAELEAGTVVVFGGSKEVTACAADSDHAVAGVVSTDPAYMMNSAAGNDHTHPYIALTGRVPVKVVGPVRKGDLLVTSDVAGHARADNNAASGRILGKAIGEQEQGQGVIEVLITLM